MYRDDQEAALARAESATRENEQLKRDNDAMRNALVHQPPTAPTYVALQSQYVYPNLDPRGLPLPERARLARHSLGQFPAAATVILDFLTFGIFGIFHYNLMHERFPQGAPNDPSGGKALGFYFIPYFNVFYWQLFAKRRLCDRLDLQLRLRGLPDDSPKGLITAISIINIFVYVGWAFNWLFLWPIANARLQSTINKVAALPPNHFDVTLLPSAPPYGVPMTPYGLAAPPPPTWR